MHREVWEGAPWCAFPVVVVEDSPELLVTYLPAGSPFAFPPSADGRPHPWAGKRTWHGNGMLALRRPGEAYSVMHFWNGPDRRFAGWYLNLEEPFRRTATGYDSQDLELDIWVPVDGPWRLKDSDLLDQRVRDGRFTDEQALAIRRVGDELLEQLDRGERWWDERWASFTPEEGWRATTFPDGWEATPPTEAPPPSTYRTLGA